MYLGQNALLVRAEVDDAIGYGDVEDFVG